MSRPSCRTRKYWTEAEDRVLRQEALLQLKDKGVVRDWNLIASKLPGRTNKDCRKRWSKVDGNVNKGAWSVEEDNRLRKGVEQHGFSWTLVAKCVATRHADQCAKRWSHFLDPNLNHEKWDSNEDDRLLNAVRSYGRSWTAIGEKEFPNRSTTDIKNRYVVIDRKHKHGLSFPSSQYQPYLAQQEITAPGENTVSNVDDELSDDGNESCDQEMVDEQFSSEFSFDLSLPGQTPSNYPHSLQSGEASKMETSQSHVVSLPTPPFSSSGFHDLNRKAAASSTCSPAISANATYPFSSSDQPFVPNNSPPSLNNPDHTDYSAMDFLSMEDLDIDPVLLGTNTAGAVTSLDPQIEHQQMPLQQQHRYTFVLEDVQPDTLSSLMSFVMQSQAKIKMKVYSSES